LTHHQLDRLSRRGGVCLRLACNWWREKNGEEECARLQLPCGPYIRFHQARSLNGPRRGLIKHRVDSNRTIETDICAFYGKLPQSQMSNRQRGGEKPFLVLFGHSHSQSQSHKSRGLPHAGTGHIEICRKARMALHRPRGRRTPQGIIPPRPRASTVRQIRRCYFPPGCPWSGSRGAAR